MRTAEMTPLIGIAEVARLLAVSKITIRRLVSAGALRCVRLRAGGPLRFDVADIQKFIAAHKQ
jgi:excisionase family DNA binding protein